VRALFTTNPLMGHVHPLVPVARAMSRAGHEVSWATSPAGVALIEGYGYRALPVGPGADVLRAQIAPVVAGVMDLPPRQRRPRMFSQFGVQASLRREDLGAVVDRLQPDVIVHEVAELAGAPIAAARELPHVTVGFSDFLSEAVLAAAVATAAPAWTDEGLEVRTDLALYDYLYLHPLPEALGARAPSQRVRRHRPLGFDGRDGDDPPDWAERLGIDRPAVYVTFGTVVGAMAPWQEILTAVGGLDIDVVATLGEGVDPQKLSAPPNVRLETFIPQSFLLGRVAAVVSHAGAGTSLTAAARGVPQLCVPISADQWENADMISSAGAGLTLEEDQRSAGDVHSALQRLLDEDDLAACAQRVAAAIDELPHPDTFVTEIEGIVRDASGS
jgi:UDP:flavonoid glycosyltransferase YjiC (YdhE family)